MGRRRDNTTQQQKLIFFAVLVVVFEGCVDHGGTQNSAIVFGKLIKQRSEWNFCGHFTAAAVTATIPCVSVGQKRPTNIPDANCILGLVQNVCVYRQHARRKIYRNTCNILKAG